MKKIKNIYNWIIRSNTDLSQKWWHRLSKVIFIISLIGIFSSSVFYLVENYGNISNSWDYNQNIANILEKNEYKDRVVSLKSFDSENQSIFNFDYKNSSLPYGFDFNTAKELRFNNSFLDTTQTFCSSNIYDHLKMIAIENNIKNFRPMDGVFQSLTTDSDAFISYLKNISYYSKCIYIDSYSISNDDDTITKYTFLTPEKTTNFALFTYKDNTYLFYIFLLLTIPFTLILAVITMLIYYKVILYILINNK